jgi:hypothetical protein
MPKIISICPLCQGACPKFSIICDNCETFSRSGLEESSMVSQALVSFRYPADMSDPWDMVKP